MVPQWRVGPLVLPVHSVFVALGVLAATVVFMVMAIITVAVTRHVLGG